MVTLNIKPLSINRMYTGARIFLTKEGQAYKKSIAWLVPKGVIVPEGKLYVRFRFHFSNASADADGPLKGTMDSIFDRLKVNDKMVYRLEIEKVLVPKGQEKIEFEILAYTQAPSS